MPEFLTHCKIVVVFVQSPSHVWLFVTPWTAACQSSLSITVSRSLPKFASNASVMPSRHLILWCPLLLLLLVLPSITDFSNESVVCIRWPIYWSLNFIISPSNKCSELISLKIDWFDLLAFQGTLRSLLQDHRSKTSILQSSAFFTVQLSQSYMANGNSIALTIQTFVGRVMSLLFNRLSRSNRLLISWLQWF